MSLVNFIRIYNIFDCSVSDLSEYILLTQYTIRHNPSGIYIPPHSRSTLNNRTRTQSSRIQAGTIRRDGGEGRREAGRVGGEYLSHTEHAELDLRGG